MAKLFSIGKASASLAQSQPAPGTSIHHDPTLIAKLRKDHQVLFDIYNRVQATFDAKDYTAALAQGSRARRSLEVTKASPPTAATPPVPTPSVSTAKTRPCPSCGAAVAVDDAFCRKCGAKVPSARVCPSCGTEVASDDAFCRRCGTKVP